MKYLFWNTFKNENINSILCDLIVENGTSVVILAEYTADINGLIELLKFCGVHMKQFTTTGCERIKILGKVELQIEPQLQNDHVSIQIIDGSLILCCVHLTSQIYSGSHDRREIEMERIVDDIMNLEQELNTRNTVIVGDFNINPYDNSCINARYFHGIPVYEEAVKGSRIVAGEEFYMFYNPMWNFLGDFQEPYGTYYHSSGDTVSTYWNIYDQVIIRPILRKRFIDDSLKIITGLSTVSLLDDRKHPNRKISDHLPITFEIKEEEYE